MPLGTLEPEETRSAHVGSRSSASVASTPVGVEQLGFVYFEALQIVQTLGCSKPQSAFAEPRYVERQQPSSAQ